jgi:hypothetical protein
MRQLKSGDVGLNQVQIVSSLLCIDDCHDITEILLKVALNTINLNLRKLIIIIFIIIIIIILS